MSSPWSVVRCLGVLDGGGWRWLGMDATVEGMAKFLDLVVLYG